MLTFLGTSEVVDVHECCNNSNCWFPNVGTRTTGSPFKNPHAFQSETLVLQKTASSRSSQCFPILELRSSRRTNAFQSFPVPRPGSQTFEPMLPNVGLLKVQWRSLADRCRVFQVWHGAVLCRTPSNMSGVRMVLAPPGLSLSNLHSVHKRLIVK